MPTFTAFTTLQARESAEGLGNAMEKLMPEPAGVGVFEIEDGSGNWEVGGYFTKPPDEVGMTILAAVFGANPFVLSELPETDWVAEVRRELKPVLAGQFFIYGNHDKDKIPKKGISLLVEAAMAFGTGHHDTTIGCLKALDFLVAEGFVSQRTADIGCGTAILAMAAASLWPHFVIASDIDAVAVEVAKTNVDANALSDKVFCIEATGFDHPKLQRDGLFDLVFANILKSPLIELAPKINHHMAVGGYAILSGILIEQAEEVICSYSSQGLYLYVREDIGEWSILTLKKS